MINMGVPKQERLESDQNALEARLTAFFRLVRTGQWEKVLEFLTLVLFGLAEYLRREFKEVVPQAGYAAYALCAGTALWLIVSVWRKAAPPPSLPHIPPEGLPNAIKGLLPFTSGSKDGALFARLGRSMELQSLLAFAENPQVGIGVVRGESGAGKTSLLQAGLAYTLGKEHCVYWEAVAVKSQEALLHAIRSQLSDLDRLDDLDALPDACPERCVLILDQFEQLRASEPEHAPIFSLLDRIGKAPAPYKLSVVVGLRREYIADWLDFEQTHGLRAEQVPINLLAHRTAGEVLITLCAESGITLDQALVDNFIFSVTSTKGVSPVDVAIGVLSLANFAQERGTAHVGLAEYKLSGGAEGLLLSFVRQKLEEIPEAICAPLLKGMALALVNPSINQRVAEGATAAVIAAKAEVQEGFLVPWLERLSHPRIRVLERAGPSRYWLPHERLVPVLRRLTGALASADRARLLFEGECARWRETHERRYLLGGNDLRGVLRQQDQLLLGEDATEYLANCLHRRTFLRLSAAGAGIASAAMVYGGVLGLDLLQQKKALQSWGLPPELFSVQHDLDGLVIGRPINDLGWLRSSRLREFSANSFSGSSLAGLEQLKNLTSLTLDLSDSQIPSLAGLDQLKSLTSLTLSVPTSQVTNLDGLKRLKSLASLTLNNLSGSQIDSLAGLEEVRGLTSLSINRVSAPPIASLAGLEQLKSLSSITLDLSGSPVVSLPGLEHLKRLTSLTLDLWESRIANLAGLERLDSLTSLTLHLSDSPIASLIGLEQLKSLTSLTLYLSFSPVASLAGLERLDCLTSLTLYLSDSRISTLAELAKLKGLTSLTLGLSDSGIASLAGLEQLTSLRSLSLDLSGSQIANLIGIERLRSLTSLTLNWRHPQVTSLAGLEHLQGLTSLTLTLSGADVPSLTVLEQLKSLTSLTLKLPDSRTATLAGLEHLRNLTSLTLDLSAANVAGVAGLKQLKSLTSVDLWLPISLVSHFARLKINAPHMRVRCRL